MRFVEYSLFRPEVFNDGLDSPLNQFLSAFKNREESVVGSSELGHGHSLQFVNGVIGLGAFTFGRLVQLTKEVGLALAEALLIFD